MTSRQWRVGITQRRIEATPTSMDRDALDASWAQWMVTHWPGAPFLAVPNFEQPEQAVAFVEQWRLNFFIFSGGEDVGTSPVRDAVESVLLSYAEAHALPVIGVCRGMQFLQVQSGGSLLECSGHAGKDHSVLAGRECFMVNSWHRFAVRHAAEQWLPLARAEDGTVEAMRHQQLPWLGLMWHPDRVTGTSDTMGSWIRSLTPIGQAFETP